MAQTLVQINKNNLRYLIDLKIDDISDRYLDYRYLFVGKPPNRFDMLVTVMMRDILCRDELNECTECLISSNLNKYKGNELRL